MRYTITVILTVLLIIIFPASAQESGLSDNNDNACDDWIETTAGWYGVRHQGQLMASGEPFDRREPTAAHRTLPLGTEVRVKNPETADTVTVRIADRGPFTGTRTIDLSQAAAEELGITHKTESSVKLCIRDAEKAVTLLQVSSFAQQLNAYRTRDVLRERGYDSRVLHNEDLFRVLVEVPPHRSVDEVRSELHEAGFPGAFPYRGPR